MNNQIDLDKIIADPIHSAVTRELAQRCRQVEAERDAFIAQSDAVHRAVVEMCGLPDEATVYAVQAVIDQRDAALAHLDKVLGAETSRDVGILELQSVVRDAATWRKGEVKA